ncbi:major facilitator superfamily domain-containing protein [Colletotrichum navitas]|uniref:Major facilitator superfamily domain-containing protein n=1 Tax=Colletotrichum navitas TaxID=681940 RepID=A0AAD8UX32_9PEZI|nr:major facilitator superfamily domain-containing protein [Colletotrichum navitas]KAK1570030.1 major facilitator superfamily domain-containing protein [Colletotrichum navitas]
MSRQYYKIRSTNHIKGGEVTPLLTPPSSLAGGNLAGGNLAGGEKPTPHKSRVIIAICIFLIVIIELGAHLIAIPLNQVLEAIICHNLEPQMSPSAADDLRCKEEFVQSELSIIRGWQRTLEFIPGLLTAVPYGYFADRRGRGIVLTLSLLGITLSQAFQILICTLPTVCSIRMTWLSALFTFIGGGPAVFTALVYAIAGECVNSEHRSTVFSYLSAAAVGGELIASPLVYLSMRINVWLSIYIGLGCLVLATVVAFTFTKTSELRAETIIKSHPCHYTTRSKRTNLRQAVSWVLWKDRSILLLMFTFLLTTLGHFQHEILLQYVTKRYNWSWSEASLLLSIRAFLNLVLLIILIPSATYFLVYKWPMSVQYTKLFLARASAVLLTVGGFVIGLAYTPIFLMMGLGIFTLGSGYRLLIRSFLASIFEEDVAMLYTLMSMFDTIGTLIAGPFLSALFRTGMDWGNAWLGMPYIVIGCLLSVVTATVFSARWSNLQQIRNSSEIDQQSDC